MRGFGARGLRDWLPPAALFVLGLVAWQQAVNVFDIQRFLLPRPTDIFTSWHDQWGALWSAGWYTFQEALWGFVVGCGAGIAVALVLARWRPLGTALMPYAIAANAIPIIAFAPIANAWFGIEQGSKIAIAAVLCFFPVMINVLRGLTSVRPSSLELMRSYAAGNFAVFRKVRVPNALPYLFSALRVASVLAMIGAIVGEYFGGDQRQLGIQIKNSAALFNFETAWAAIIVACILGIAFYLAVSLAEKLAMRTYPARGTQG